MIQSEKNGDLSLATLTLSFAVPAQALRCASVTRTISHLSISKVAGRQARGAYGCQQANAVSNTWALRFEARMQVQSFTVDDIAYRCKLAPTVPQNTQCEGGGTRVKFAAYGISSLIAGTAGWMYAYNFGSVSAARFGFLVALAFVAFAFTTALFVKVIAPA